MLKRNERSSIRNRLADSDKPPAVKSISRAGNILLCLGAGHGTITEIAARCKLSKSTVHRLLKALEETLLVSQNPINHRYYLGPLITQFSSNPNSTHDFLLNAALPDMKRLAETSGETVTLVLMAGSQSLPLYEIPSPSDLKVIYSGVQRRVSLFTGATTRVLLAQLPPNELRIILKNVDRDMPLPEGIKDMAALEERLEQVRRQGYDVSRGESIPGALCIAVPITCYVLPAALSVIGPDSRIEPRREDVTRELKNTAERISRDIGSIYGPKPIPE